MFILAVLKLRLIMKANLRLYIRNWLKKVTVKDVVAGQDDKKDFDVKKMESRMLPFSSSSHVEYSKASPSEITPNDVRDFRYE